jgi:hypothetical protein
MIIIVCGGRNYQNRENVFTYLDELHAFRQISMVIHGACMQKGSIELCGADRWAEEWACYREVAYMGIPAKWSTQGNSAGPIRNRTMRLWPDVELVVAFPGGVGTQNMIDLAHKGGIKVWEPCGN